MPIRYRLHMNKLKNAPAGAYKAAIKREGTWNAEDVVNEMVLYGRTPWPASQCLAFLEEFTATVIRLILEGNHVNTDLVNCCVSMSGNFDGPKDRFRKGRNKLHIKLSPGKKLRAAMKKMPTPEKY